MTSTDVVFVAGNDADLIRRFTAVRGEIKNASPQDLLKIVSYSEAAQAAARVMVAFEVQREAALTRLYAERRLGELLAKDKGLSGDLEWIPPYCEDLGRIPERLFEQAVNDMTSEGKVAAARVVCNRAMMNSLKKLEPGLWQSWDDGFYYKSYQRNRYIRANSRSREGALVEMSGEAGLSTRWAKSESHFKIDESHARARRLAQALSLLGQSVKSDAKELVAKAELKQAEVASLLYEAYLLEANANYDPNWRAKYE